MKNSACSPLIPYTHPLLCPSDPDDHTAAPFRSGTAEKELEREVQRIADTLRDDRTANWKDRIGALHRVVALVAGGAAEQVKEWSVCLFVYRIGQCLGYVCIAPHTIWIAGMCVSDQTHVLSLNIPLIISQVWGHIGRCLL